MTTALAAAIIAVALLIAVYALVTALRGRAMGLPDLIGLGVLEVLLAAQGRVVPAEELLERVWDEMADPFTTAVKVTVSRLRRKLGDPPVIETVAQAGYRI